MITSMSPFSGTSLSVFATMTTVCCAMKSGKAPSRLSLSLVTTKSALLRPPANRACGLPIKSSLDSAVPCFAKRVCVLVTSKPVCRASGTSTSALKPFARSKNSDALHARIRLQPTSRPWRNRCSRQRGSLPPPLPLVLLPRLWRLH